MILCICTPDGPIIGERYALARITDSDIGEKYALARIKGSDAKVSANRASTRLGSSQRAHEQDLVQPLVL